MHDFEPLTDEQVQAGARPGESWEQARLRMECGRDSDSGNLSQLSGAVKLPAREMPVSCVDEDEFDVLWAFEQLTPRERYEYRLEAEGRSIQDESILECPSLASLVKDAQGWMACCERLPHEDVYGRLRYIVYSPGYGGWLHRCSYDSGQWPCESLGLSIGGVTHWRLANDGEVERQAETSELPSNALNEIQTKPGSIIRPR